MWNLNFFQHLPNFFQPVAFSIGNLSVYWYSLMWIVAFGVVYFLLLWRIKIGEGVYSKSFIQDIITNSLIGALIGGRIGYVIFYDFSYYWMHPLQIISPYDFVLKEWVGIYGMSYHGGIIGVVVAVIWTARKKRKNILDLFDFIVPVVPIGYMFGRFGNFFNSELVGRITTSKFGMYFNDEIVLRHPSQLYEAFCEGLMLFIILWSIRNYKFQRGTLGALYLIGYSVARFIVEFFRQPDEQLGFVLGILTMGQILSILMFVVGIIILFIKKKNRKF